MIKMNSGAMDMKRINRANRLADLKRIEQIALEEIKNCLGRYYAGKDQDIERLQQIARQAKMERLELELYGR